jgi:hypothetical protein
MALTAPFNAPLYAMGNDGKFISITMRELNGTDALNQALARNVTFKLPSAFKSFDELPVNLMIKNDTVYMAAKLQKLVFNTTFQINAERDEYLIRFEQNREYVQNQLNWIPPTDMTLYFGVLASATAIPKTFMNAYLFAVKTGVAGFLKLPLPNWFPDGRLCMGDNLRTENHPQLDGFFNNILQRFYNSPWNTHLIDGQLANIQRLFKWKVTTNEQLPIENGVRWEDLSARINSEHLEAIYGCHN